MIKDVRGNRITPNQVAKDLVLQKLDDLMHWPECCEELSENLTKKEWNAIDDALRKQRRRVRKFLGYGPTSTFPRVQ